MSVRSLAIELEWSPRRGTDEYHIEVFRDGSRVFGTVVRHPRVTFPAIWTVGGSAYRIDDSDRVYVWALSADGRVLETIVDGRRIGELP